MRDGISLVRVALVGLAPVLCAAIVGFIAFAGVNKIEEAKAKPNLLRSWSNARIHEEMGEYDQRLDCAQIGAPGLTGYVWVKVNALTGQPTSVLFLCEP